MERIPIKDNPKLFEGVIQQIQLALGDAESGLTWLDHIFGKAEKVKRDYPGHKDFRVPSVYVGAGKYEEIVPDANDWGNYAFFYMEEPQDLEEYSRVQPYYRLRGDVNLIVWGDSRDIESQDDRNLESIKSEILQVLGGITLTQGGRVLWRRVYEQGRDVFDEYSFKEEDGQLTMWPYFAFRFKGEIECWSGCVEG